MRRGGRLRLNEEDWEDEDDLIDDEEGGSHLPEVTGPSFMPAFTGLYKANGDPILRHPVALRVGFWPEDMKLYTPTLEDDGVPGSSAVIGWVYD